MRRLILTSAAGLVLSLGLTGCHTMNNANSMGNSVVNTGVGFTKGVVNTGLGFGTAAVGTGVGMVSAVGATTVSTVDKGTRWVQKGMVYHNGHYVARH